MTEILEELAAIIGLKMCDGIGDITANKLISYCGTACNVLKEKKAHLSSIPGISLKIYEILQKSIPWSRVEKEVNYIEKNKINYVTIFDKTYPKSLQNINSSPLMLFFKGSIEKLNLLPCISIVGTRGATNYGLNIVAEITSKLKDKNVCIISGLALGIDISAHKESLQNSIPTFGIVAHGIKTIYPSIHTQYAQKMAIEGGGIITEFFSDEKPNRENFPKRNRIIAGLSFATIVVEASKSGGALITAELAISYKKKVFAVPGRLHDKYSEGCNLLLKNNLVKPILSVDSLIDELGFKQTQKKEIIPIPKDLSIDEKKIIQLLQEKLKASLDDISNKTQLNISHCSSVLFGLELKGILIALPGKVYKLA